MRLILGVNIVAVPINHIVLIVLTEFMESVYLVLNNLLTRAFLKVIVPADGDVV